MRKRRDFRDVILFTIDPANAKDFDDAISFREIPHRKHHITNKELYEVGVHIADVSHYVREGTALDREARERGTSVYLVDRTIPMLPHAISNDLCSLNPDVDRLAFSAVFEMDKNGRVHNRWFGKSVIHSRKRFTYETAQEVIDRASPRTILGSERIVLGDFTRALTTLNAIAKKLRAQKTKEGAIDFEQDEVGFELDEKGHPIRVFKKKRLDTHKLIEEFMLLANREVARFFDQASKQSGGKISFIYRTHDVPDREKLEQLGIFVRALGHELPIRKDASVSGKDLQALFSAIEGHASESLIKTAAIRSIAKAMYSTANIGHFGLAFEYYTHFTSPIRRYPDLLVHRSLLSILERHTLDPQKFARLERMASDATQKEIAAAEAERESIKLKQVEYMKERVGKEFEGVISGVTEWGIYVEEKETRSEGMAKLRDLHDDYYVLDQQNYAVVGQKTKKKYSLGDTVRFKVMGADVERKTLDYRIV
ncbi:MAG: VacB/RNase II family 3'-5' exoribonuclease [Patescibacteria group bacterium]